jgi:hypothetical protein
MIGSVFPLFRISRIDQSSRKHRFIFSPGSFRKERKNEVADRSNTRPGMLIFCLYFQFNSWWCESTGSSCSRKGSWVTSTKSDIVQKKFPAMLCTGFPGYKSLVEFEVVDSVRKINCLGLRIDYQSIMNPLNHRFMWKLWMQGEPFLVMNLCKGSPFQ